MKIAMISTVPEIYSNEDSKKAYREADYYFARSEREQQLADASFFILYGSIKAETVNKALLIPGLQSREKARIEAGVIKDIYRSWAKDKPVGELSALNDYCGYAKIDAYTNKDFDQVRIAHGIQAAMVENGQLPRLGSGTALKPVRPPHNGPASRLFSVLPGFADQIAYVEMGWRTLNAVEKRDQKSDLKLLGSVTVTCATASIGLGAVNQPFLGSGPAGIALFAALKIAGNVKSLHKEGHRQHWSQIRQGRNSLPGMLPHYN